jgi:putative solute:sodium symporter small subunit
MSAQGSLLVYVALIWYYQHYMNKLDIEYGVDEGEDE